MPETRPDASADARLPWTADDLQTMGPQLQTEWGALAAQLDAELASVEDRMARRATAERPSVAERVGRVVRPRIGTLAGSAALTGAAVLGHGPSPETLTQILAGYLGVKSLFAGLATWGALAQRRRITTEQGEDERAVGAVRVHLAAATAAVAAQQAAPEDPRAFADALAAIGAVREQVQRWRGSLRPALALARQTRRERLSPAAHTQYRQQVDGVHTLRDALALDTAWRQDPELIDRPDLLTLRMELLAKFAPTLVLARELGGPTSPLPDIVQLTKGSLDQFTDPVPTLAKYLETPEALAAAEAQDQRLRDLRFATQLPDARASYEKRFLTVGTHLGLLIEHAHHEGQIPEAEAERWATASLFGKVVQKSLAEVVRRGLDVHHDGTLHVSNPGFFFTLGDALQDSRGVLASSMRDARRAVRLDRQAEESETQARWAQISAQIAREVAPPVRDAHDLAPETASRGRGR